MTALPSRRRPPGRYDEPSKLGQRAVAVLLSLLFLALLAAIGSTLRSRFGGDAVRGQVLGYDVRSDAEVVIDLEVSKSAGRQAYCVVRARGRDGTEVGRDVAVLDAVGSPERTARGTFSLATTARAVTGEVRACTSKPITRGDAAP
ncbi:MAG: hypothetical protein JWN88_2717 [Frankiales bacterium]|nr:hypothetical protein [Frankiales bacterium]